jgi:cytochrome P450 family 130
VGQFVVERIERLRANGGGDIVAELFRPLASVVIADYLGVPEADRSHFDGWAEAIGNLIHQIGGNCCEATLFPRHRTVGKCHCDETAFNSGVVMRR